MSSGWVEDESSCSIEVWVQPGLRHDSNTLLAFYTRKDPIQVALQQSDTDLLIERDAGRGGRPARNGPWRERCLSLDAAGVHSDQFGIPGSTVYIDGVLARAARRFLVTAGDCTGWLWVPHLSETMTGPEGCGASPSTTAS